MFRLILAIALTIAMPTAALWAAPIGGHFTYQGRLMDGGQPANGTYDLVFTLWDDPGSGNPPTGGNQIGAPVSKPGTQATDGLLTVAINEADEFGAAPFIGDARWLQVAVNGTPLAPRQPLASAPFSLQTRGIAVDGTGNVGIGTLLPQSPLHVAGDLRATDRVALGNDAFIGLGGGAYPDYDRILDFSHVITDFSSSPYWSPLLSTVTLDPNADLTAGEQVYGNSFETHIAQGSPRDFDFIVGLYGAAVHKGSGQGGNLLGGLVFSGPQGPGTLARNYGLAVDAGGSFGATGTITKNIGISIITGHWGDGGSVTDDRSLWVQAPQFDQPVQAHYGIYLDDQNVAQTTNYAIYSAGGDVYFNGDLEVTGTLSKGGGSFKIDHPLDPANKYLYHSFVESPDMLNIYNGNAITDDRGYAVVVLPDWFEALNRDYRYQLTVIDDADRDDFAQVKVVREVRDGRFTIRSSAPRVRVSWQVTGIRHDAWAEANRIPVEIEKPVAERGKYLHPHLRGSHGEPGNSGPAAERRIRPRR